MKYRAFISYSHAADGRLAPALQHGLHRFAKPWHQMRALHVFRDKTDLATNPQLWESIKSALDVAEWFILLASPQAAASIWVRREIDRWLERRTADRILIVLTAGSLEWDRNSGAFDPQRTDALPPSLMRGFKDEPLHLDLRWARNETDLSLRNPRFVEAVADLAATLHGRPKDELVGEDVRQYRRTRWLARSAIAGLTILTLVSVIGANYAFHQRNIARTERAAALQQSRIALARQLAAQSGSMLVQFADRLPLAVLLALESTSLHLSFEGNQALRAALALLPSTIWSPAYEGDQNRARVRAMAFSAGGKLLATAREDGSADLLDVLEQRTVAILAHDETPGAITDSPDGGVRWKAPGVDKEVISVAFSADDRLVATGSNDNSARLWDTTNGRELLRLQHDDGVASVAFHPGRALLATGSKDGNMRLWDVNSGLEAARIKHAEEVREVAFSPDGRYVAAISTDGRITLFDLDRKDVHKAWSTGDAGLGLAFSGDSTKLATASGEVAAVFEVRTGKKLFKATHVSPAKEATTSHLLWIVDVVFSPDGKYLATAGRDGTARVWNHSTGQELVRLQHAAAVENLAFSPDGASLITASFDGTARLWELPAGRERLRAVHPGGSEVVAFSPDGHHVASGGTWGAIQLWRLTRGDQLGRMEHAGEVRAVGFSPDGKLLATSDDKGSLRLWSIDGAIKSELHPLWGAERVMFSADGRFVAVQARNPALSVMDVGSNLAATQLPRFQNAGRPALSTRYLAAWDREHRSLVLWETSGGREIARAEADDLWGLGFDPTAAFLATRHEDSHQNGVIRVWTLPDLREMGRISIKGGPTFALGPGGRYLALTVSEPGEQKYSPRFYVDLWDVAAPSRVARIPQQNAVVLLAFAPTGQALITLGDGSMDDDRELKVWQLPAGTLRARLAHEKSIQKIQFSAEDHVIATVSDGRVYVWNSLTGNLLSQFTDTGDILDVRFSPDGRYLLTGSRDHTAALWLWRTDDMRVEACRRLTRNFSPEEWLQYVGTTPYRETCPDLPKKPGPTPPLE